LILIKTCPQYKIKKIAGHRLAWWPTISLKLKMKLVMANIIIKKEGGKGLIGCYEGSKEELKNMLSELMVEDDDFFALTAAAYEDCLKARTSSNSSWTW